MKLLFAHDHYFIKDKKGNLYTSGSFNEDVWSRYLKHFTQVKVATRLTEVNCSIDENTYNSFNLENLDHIEIPNISGIQSKVKNTKKAEEILVNEIRKVDAVIARLPSEIGNLAIKIAKEQRKPYAIEVVACVWDALYNHGTLKAKIYAPVAYIKMRNNVKQSSYTLYVTENFLQRRYPSFNISTNVSNVELKEVASEGRELIKKNEYSIGMIGSLKNNIKGWTVAFNALKLLKETGLSFKLYILGDGPQKKWKQKISTLGLSDNIVFCGTLPGGEPVMQWLDNLDVYIQPSFQEGLPRAVIESMSRGLPILGSDAGGIPELLDPIAIHKVGDYVKLSKDLLNILTDFDLYKRLSVNNLNKSRKYESEILNKKRSDFWNEFVEFIKISEEGRCKNE